MTDATTVNVEDLAPEVRGYIARLEAENSRLRSALDACSAITAHALDSVADKA